MRSSRVGGRDRKIQRKQRQTKCAKRKVHSSTFACRSVVYKSASGGVLCWLTLNGHIPIWRVREPIRIVIKQILIYLAGANVAYFSSSQVHFFFNLPLSTHTKNLDLRSDKDVSSSLHTQFGCQAAAGVQTFLPLHSPHPPHFIFPFVLQEVSCLGKLRGPLITLVITGTSDDQMGIKRWDPFTFVGYIISKINKLRKMEEK